MMKGQTMFLVCPAYLDTDGTRRCGLPAEVETRYTMRSTDGPLESAKIRCPRNHWFNGPIEFLTVQEQPAAATTSTSATNVLAEGALDGANVLGPDTPADTRLADTGRFLKNFGRASYATGHWHAAITGRPPQDDNANRVAAEPKENRTGR
jgi:hypothetical protein